MRLITVGLLGALVSGCAPSALPTAPAPGRSAPPSASSEVLGRHLVMDLPSSTGAVVSIGDGGEPLVLDFWAPTCQPCVKKVPELVARNADLKAQGARLILVAVLAEGESTAMAERTLASWGVSHPFLVDREDVSRAAAAITELPATLVLDGRHVVTWVAGPTSSAEEVVLAARHQPLATARPVTR